MSSKGTAKGKTRRFFDYTLLFVVLFLLMFGLVMLYSVSSYDANITFGRSDYYLKKQIQATVLGIVMMLVVMLVDYHIWERFAIVFYVVSAILILLVLTPLGIEANGARRWLNLGLSLQPAEVAKLGMIIFSASLVVKMGKKLNSLKGFVFTVAWSVPICLMVYLITDNLSSAIIIFGIVLMMVFVATPNYKGYILVLALIFAMAALIVFLVSKGIITEESSYRIGRIKAWLDPEAYSSTTAFQTLQALYAIGSGGVFGKGLGQSMQKQFIPEAQNDMIFAIICEELGLFGAISVIVLFLILVWRLVMIANNAPDAFGAMLVVGALAHISIQVVLNIAVVTNSIPNTGISLPFISYGGSSVVFLLIEIGLVLSVARGIRLD